MFWITQIDTSFFKALGALTIAAFVYFACLVIHRLFLSPLRRFPGPKIAAATGWYEFYYQFWRDGKYVFEIEKMHQKYGPIVRVNPEELSIRDPDFYNELYVTENRRRTEHYASFGRGIGLDDSHLFTKDHQLHKVRRKPMEPFFSRPGIARLQPMFGEVALHLETRLRSFSGTSKVIRLDHALSAYTGDIISRIVLDTPDDDVSFLSDPDFSVDWSEVMLGIILSIPLFTAFPWIIKLLSFVPQQLLLWAYPRGQAFDRLSQRARRQVRNALASESSKETDATSLFHHIARSDMPDSEKSEDRLAMEGALLLAAGTFTSSRTIGTASYFLLSRPQLRRELQAELAGPMSQWPDRVPSWAELERLPLLQAVIKETLRFTYGVMHRLPRISPDVPIQYKEYTIPPGVPVGMSAYLMHTDADVYESPFEFKPERWIDNPDQQMMRNYVPFAKGSRNCIGLYLAMAEITLALAVLFRPGGPSMQLHETDESDVRLVHDYAVALPKLDTKGLRVVVR